MMVAGQDGSCRQELGSGGQEGETPNAASGLREREDAT